MTDRVPLRSIEWHERVLDAVSDPGYRDLIQKKIAENSTRSGDCTLWTGTRCKRSHYGYMMVKMVPKVRITHLIMMLHGIDPRGLMVRHSCDNPPCINEDHLSLGTAADNNLDSVKRGRTADPSTKARGADHGRAKLTEAQVKLVMFLVSQGAEQREIAKWLGVCKSTIGNISRREVWKCLDL